MIPYRANFILLILASTLMLSRAAVGDSTAPSEVLTPSARSGTTVNLTTYLFAFERVARPGRSPKSIADLEAISRVEAPDGTTKAPDRTWMKSISGLTSKGSELRAVAGRVTVACQQRPWSFQPVEVRRRLRDLMNQLCPTRNRGRALSMESSTPLEQPVVRSVQVCGHGSQSYTLANRRSGSDGLTTVVSASGGTGKGSTVVQGYGAPTTHTGPAVSTRSTVVQGSNHRKRITIEYARPAGQTVTQATPQVHNTPQVTPPPGRVSSFPVVSPAAVKTPPPKPPVVEPPPKAPEVTPRSQGLGLLEMLLIGLGLLMPVGLYALKRRLRNRSREPEAPRVPRCARGLVDPEHQDLAPEAIVLIGRQAASSEDWMRAIRYLFASLLMELTLQGFKVQEFHTNREIAGLMRTGSDSREYYWSAATLFELFFYGERQPVESDFRLFESLVAQCRHALASCGGTP